MKKEIDYENLWDKEVIDKIDKNEIYNIFYNLESHKDIIPIEKALLDNIDKDSNILDIGCSFGRLMRFFKNSIGIDVSKEMLKRNPFKKRIKIMDASQKIDFPDNTFDNVICFRVLLHLNNHKDIPNVLRESFRVLKKEGYFYVDVSKKYNLIWELKKIYWYLKGGLIPISAKEVTIKKMKSILKKQKYTSYEIIDGDKTSVIFKIKNTVEF